MKILQLILDQCSEARYEARVDIRKLYELDEISKQSGVEDIPSKVDEDGEILDDDYIIAKLNVLEPHLAGYISRLSAKSYSDDELQEWIAILRRYNFTSIPYIQDWYVEESEKYPMLRLYINELDYLRLKLIEYFESILPQ